LRIVSTACTVVVFLSGVADARTPGEAAPAGRYCQCTCSRPPDLPGAVRPWPHWPHWPILLWPCAQHPCISSTGGSFRCA